MPGQGPLLSIVVPTYNRLAALKLSLPGNVAVAEKLAPQLQLVISDNASTDGSWDYIQEVAGGRQGVVVRREPVNTGDGDTHFISALADTTGQYLWAVADDDEIHPQAVAALVSALAGFDRPFAHLPVEGVYEADRLRGRLPLAGPDQPGAFVHVPAHESLAAACAVVGCFWAANLWGRDALLEKVPIWQAWHRTGFPHLRAMLEIQADQDALPVFNQICVYGNRWEEIEQRVPVVEMLCVGRLEAYVGAPDSALKRAMRSHMEHYAVRGAYLCLSGREGGRLGLLPRLLRVSPRFMLSALTCGAVREALGRRSV